MPSEPIPLCVPSITGNEWKYVKECLDTGWVSSVGASVGRFESEFAARVGTKHSVATASGTAALHLALIVAGVGPNDEVLVPGLTFIAAANAVFYVGAHPVFVGVERDFWQIDPHRLAEFLAAECGVESRHLINRRTGRRIAAVLPVHNLGHPCEIGDIMGIAEHYGLPVVEDATEALGARYRGRPPGSFGVLGCFSFNGNKLITTGGGGMLVSNDAALADRARYLSAQAKDGEEFVHGAVGFNYRLTNLAAAMGLAQLEQYDEFLSAKRRIAAYYGAALADLQGITVMPEAAWADSAFWMYTILVEPKEFGMDCRVLGSILAAEGIQTRRLWEPLPTSRPYRRSQSFRCEYCDWLAARGLSLPCSVGITEDQQDRVIRAIRRSSVRAAARS
jgi:perosamine synthetase